MGIYPQMLLKVLNCHRGTSGIGNLDGYSGITPNGQISDSDCPQVCKEIWEGTIYVAAFGRLSVWAAAAVGDWRYFYTGAICGSQLIRRSTYSVLSCYYTPCCGVIIIGLTFSPPAPPPLITFALQNPQL